MVKHFPAHVPDWAYTLRVAAALRSRGWPTPEPVEEPLVRPAGAWVVFRRLPGRPAGGDASTGQRARGRLLAELHAAAADTGIHDQRDGFGCPAEVVGDPELDHALRRHEAARPEEGRLLRACRDATAQWFADHDVPDAPRSVIHGDFAPWNLLYDDGRLTGVLDFEASHHSYQVADFALSWRGHHDDVLRGYDEVRPLSDGEWQLVRPVFGAWMFLRLGELLARPGAAPDLRWQVDHLRRHSPLLAARCGR